MCAELRLAGAPSGRLKMSAATAVDRRFLAVFGLSLLLHVALLLWAHGVRPAVTQAMPPLIATLRSIVAPVSQAPAPAALQPQARQPEARSVHRLAPPAMMTAGPANAPALPAAPATSAVPSALPAVAAPALSLPGEFSARPPAPAVDPAAGERVQADLLAGYRRQLAELFARHQEYPRLAALRGWEGEVRVRLKVARKGSLLDVRLDQSSGFEVLDRHALAMLGELSGLPALPEALVPEEIQVVVPIQYKLKKTT